MAQRKIFRDKYQECFPVLHISLIILINTAGAPNQVRLPAFDICNPHGKHTAEPTPDMQIRGERFVERVKKTESCRQ